MKKALVLGGGGSKGAYEIGVWQALEELQLTFDIVCGTSIGAMIGTLYVQHDYQKAYDLWSHLQIEDIMANGINLDFDISLLMSQKGQYTPFLKSYFHHKGMDIQPFEEMIDSLFDADRFFSSAIDFGCECVNVTQKKAQTFRKQDMNAQTAKEYILASAACFPAFPMKSIQQDKFIDGGYADNVPIQLAKDMGADIIVAIDLKSIGHVQIKKPQEQLIYIEPKVPLGSFLSFEHAQIMRNIQLGYLDTLKVFHTYTGGIYTFFLDEEAVIQAFEETMKKGIQDIYTFLHMQEVSAVHEYLATHQLMKGLAQYQGYTFPFFSILEHAALAYDIDCLQVYHVQDFLSTLLHVAKSRFPIISNLHSAKKIKEALVNSICTKQAELISIQLYYLQKEKGSHLILQMLAALTNDTFLMAYALYLLQERC